MTCTGDMLLTEPNRGEVARSVLERNTTSPMMLQGEVETRLRLLPDLGAHPPCATWRGSGAESWVLDEGWHSGRLDWPIRGAPAREKPL